MVPAMVNAAAAGMHDDASRLATPGDRCLQRRTGERSVDALLRTIVGLLALWHAAGCCCDGLPSVF